MPDLRELAHERNVLRLAWPRLCEVQVRSGVDGVRAECDVSEAAALQRGYGAKAGGVGPGAQGEAKGLKC